MAARILKLDPKDRWALSYRRNLLFYIGDLEGYQRESRGKSLYPNGKMVIEGISKDLATESTWPTCPSSLADPDYREGHYDETIRAASKP